MAQRANIVSFDVAKRNSAARSREASAQARYVVPGGTGAARKRSRRRGSAARPSSEFSARKNDALLDDDAFWAEIRGDRNSGSGFSGGRASSASGAASSFSRSRADKTEARIEDRFADFDDFYNDMADSPEDELSAKQAKSKGKRRKRAKERADKMFTKQFGDDAPDASEGAPRAAVYEGKMGKTTRRAARLVPSGKAASVAAGFNPFGWVAGIVASSRRLVVAAVLVCVVGSCAALYAPAQQFYQSLRDNDRAQAQYAALENRADALEAQNATLTSDVGVETIAHKDYGWVKSGEQTAKVEGLSDSAYAKEEAGSSITANVAINNIDYPETWYSPVLDRIFGVK